MPEAASSPPWMITADAAGLVEGPVDVLPPLPTKLGAGVMSFVSQAARPSSVASKATERVFFFMRKKKKFG
jgi:hypothetical protein